MSENSPSPELRDLPVAMMAAVMNYPEIADFRAVTIVDAPREALDISGWRNVLSGRGDSQTSLTTTPDGERMSIDVEVVGGGLMMRYFIERIDENDHVLLESVSDVVTRTGRMTTRTLCEMSIRAMEADRSEFSIQIRSRTSRPVPSQQTSLPDIISEQRMITYGQHL